jgi:hypothetical protein
MNATTIQLLARRVLLGVGVFNALSALVGGALLIIGGFTGGSGGMGIPLSVLDDTPFTTFLWPGVILAVVVGGTQVLAVALQILRDDLARLAAAVAGFALVIWMFVEVALLPGINVLQVIYFGTGALQLALLTAALGVLPAAAESARGTAEPRLRHAV